MKIHDTKKDALTAIKRYAEIMREASKETGADFVAYSYDDYGMEYYVDAAYRGIGKKIHEVRVHFQELNL